MNPIAVDRLKSQLLTSGLQQKDQPLYQVINQLIGFVRQLIDETGTAVDSINTAAGTPPTQTFITTEDELSGLPNSRRITAGTGIQFNNNGQRLIISGSIIPDMDEDENYYESPPTFTLNNSQVNVPGEWTFNNNLVKLDSTSPRLVLRDRAGGVNSQYWVMTVNAGNLYFQAFDDALSASSNALLFVRSGIHIDSVRLQTGLGVLRTFWNQDGVMDHRFGLMLSGQSSVSLTGDQTAWNPTGLGSVFFIGVTGTSNWIIRGITAQSAGTYIVVHNRGASVITFTHEDGAASAANRIWVPGSGSVTIPQQSVVQLYYNGLDGRWQMIGYV